MITWTVVGYGAALTAGSAVFLPISWQDFGSGVFATAAVALMLGFGPRRDEPARRVATLAGLSGLGALLVDMYLY